MGRMVMPVIYCTHCGSSLRSDSRFCTHCGGRSAPPPEHDNDRAAVPPAPSGQPRRLLVVLLVLLLVVGGGGALAWATLIRRADSAVPPVPPVTQPPGLLSSPVAQDPPAFVPAATKVTSASASCNSPPSRDAGGTTVTYGPEQAVDGVPDTAWRCDGAGVGEQLVLSFPGQLTLAGVGLVPGYAKTDAYDGTDRYIQNRRISVVRYTFDDGSSVLQNFGVQNFGVQNSEVQDSAAGRELQTITLQNVSTTHLTITILGSVEGEATNGQPPSDRVAISEVAVSLR